MESHLQDSEVEAVAEEEAESDSEAVIEETDLHSAEVAEAEIDLMIDVENVVALIETVEDSNLSSYT